MSDASADHREPVIVGSYVDVGEAEVAQAKLRAFGIEAAIVDRVEGGAIPMAEMDAGVGVEVRAADAEDARRVLGPPDKEPGSAADESDADESAGSSA
jgi:hypothetical protein